MCAKHYFKTNFIFDVIANLLPTDIFALGSRGMNVMVHIHNAHLESRHTIVYRATNAGMRQTSMYFTGTKTTPFSRMCSLIMAGQKLTIFSVETSSG